MYKIISIISIVLFLSNFSLAQSFKKAFRALDNKEYTSARVQFSNAQKDISTKAIGDYGIAVIQRSTALRIEDLYSAFSSAESAKENWAKCSDAAKKKNKDFVNLEIINGELSKIEDLLFAKVKADGSTMALENFINKCPQSRYNSQVVKLLNTAAYNKAKTFNTIPVWKEFIKKYPNAPEAKLAQVNIDSIAWNKVIRNSNIENLEAFINQYPKSKKIKEAKKMLLDLEYNRAKAINTSAAFTSFISKYHNSKQAKELQEIEIENDYNNVMKFKEIGLCESFINTYPNNLHIAQIKQIRDSLAYLKVLKENTPEAYEDFIMKYPNAKQVSMAMAKIGTLMYSKEELKRISKKNDIKKRKLKSYTVYQMNISDTNNKVLSEKKRFDIFGNCTYFYNNVTEDLKEVYKYSYDDAGDKLLKEQYFVNNKIKTISYFTYNIKGQVVNVQIVCNYDCLDSTGDYSDTLIYNNDRLLIEKTKRNSYGKIVEQHKYTYDIKGNKVLDNYTVLSNDSIYSLTIKNDYDGRDLLIQKTKKDKNGNIVSVGSYSYDGLGRMISSSFYDKVGTIYYTYFYGKDGALKSETIMNEANSTKKYIKIYNYEQYKSN